MSEIQESFLPAGNSLVDSDEWYTPAWLFRALGHQFDLDPCSPGVPPSNVWAKTHWTKDDNGLGRDWFGSVWLNPPFSSRAKWYTRLSEHGDGIALGPAGTDTRDFSTLVTPADAVLLVTSRICFERGGAEGEGRSNAPPFGTVLVAFGDAMKSVLLKSQITGVRLLPADLDRHAPGIRRSDFGI
jgi:hypothetical protein